VAEIAAKAPLTRVSLFRGLANVMRRTVSSGGWRGVGLVPVPARSGCGDGFSRPRWAWVGCQGPWVYQVSPQQ